MGAVAEFENQRRSGIEIVHFVRAGLIDDELVVNQMSLQGLNFIRQRVQCKRVSHDLDAKKGGLDLSRFQRYHLPSAISADNHPDGLTHPKD
jgi:hypothetical protein